jgi:hypothetical protein
LLSAAERGLDTHHRKQAGRRDHARDPDRVGRARQVKAPIIKSGHVVERLVLLFVIHEVRIRVPVLVHTHPLIVEPDHRDAIRAFVRQRPEQDGIDHAEDGGVCAYAHRQREHD